MKIEDFQDMIQFAVNAMNRKNIKDIKVQVIVKTKHAALLLDIAEIGFDEKEAVIYIEA